MEAIRVEAMVQKGSLVEVPGLTEGELVEVIVLRRPRKPKQPLIGGWGTGKIQTHPGFDDPIPGMEDLQ